MTAPLAGRTVVVTRAGEQAGRLQALLEDAGATVLALPTIAIEDPPDGGEALEAAMREPWDWVVVTSPNGARRTVAAAKGRTSALPLTWAVVGPGTATVLSEAGVTPALVPERFVAEGLLESFPPPPTEPPGRVLIAQAERARPVLADGLRARGWEVHTVIAYRTVSARPAPELVVAARAADAVAFTSGSTVAGFVDAVGRDSTPAVVAIGPVTADAARALGLDVSAVADPHTLDGLVAAVVTALR